MKITYISDSAIPSSSPNSVHVMKMCQAFALLGHEVTLYGKNTTSCFSRVNDVHSFYAVDNGFNISIYPNQAFKGSGMFYNLSFIWRILLLRSDLFYTRSILAAFFLLLYGRQIVFEVHEPFEGKGRLLNFMFSFIKKHKRLRKMVVISDALRKYYVNSGGMSLERIMVAHDGADPFVAARPVINDPSIKVGYIGSLYPGKGLEILVPLARVCSNVVFHVVGGNEEQVEKAKKEAGDVQNLVFHGFKSQQEIPGYISSFDVLIAPYSARVIVSEKKGANNLALWMSPLKLFEYMASGKPIISTALPVIKEVLQHGYNALLCDPENLEQWKERIYQMVSDADLRARLSKRALEDFNSRYTWQKRAAYILSNL